MTNPNTVEHGEITGITGTPGQVETDTDRITVQSLAELLGLDLEIKGRADANLRESWSASLGRSEIKNGGILAGAVGFGVSAQEALVDLCATIAGQRLVIDAYSEDRREFNVPKDLWVRVPPNKLK